MRLLGNKSKLLGDIETLLLERGVAGGTFIDIFAGTSSVARHLKRMGFLVKANDRLSMCFAKAVASVEVSSYPDFRRLRERYAGVLASSELARAYDESRLRQRDFAVASDAGAEPPAGASTRQDSLARIVTLLNHFVPGQEGMIYRSFCPGGAGGRAYFTDENGRRIDGILVFLRDNLRRGNLRRSEFYLLLSALVDAADRVANISGTYGAFLKSWQVSSRKPLVLGVPEIIVDGKRHRAYQRDANQLIREITGDVLYVDPPYNHRQYVANYHVLEIIAEHHAIEDPAAYEASLYGRTGLRPYADLKSAFCVAPGRAAAGGQDAWGAMSDLILNSQVRHVVVSYNEEGILTRDEIGAILARFAGRRRFDFDRDFREVVAKRFRSDRDRAAGGGGLRRYRVVEGKKKDEIGEWLFFASRDAKRPRPRARARTSSHAARPEGG